MIVVEERLRELFDLIPEIYVKNGVSNKPAFSWGDKLALNQFLTVAYKDSSFKTYPLIWLLPSEDSYNNSVDILDRRVSLVLATLETRKDLLNDHRLQGTYKNTLNPLTEYVIQALNNGSIINYISPLINILKSPNYSINEDNESIERWDAVRIDLDVQFNNKCLNPIKWQNPQN